MSAGEKFIIVYETRIYKNIEQVRYHIFSIYENKSVFDS